MFFKNKVKNGKHVYNIENLSIKTNTAWLLLACCTLAQVPLQLLGGYSLSSSENYFCCILSCFSKLRSLLIRNKQ